MRRLMLLIAVCIVAFLAVSVYRTADRTREAKSTLAQLQRDIAKEREAIAILSAEWAYLNRPTRLRQLANDYYDELGLDEIRAENYGEANMVPFSQASLANDDAYLEISEDEINAILADLQNESSDGEWP